MKQHDQSSKRSGRNGARAPACSAAGPDGTALLYDGEGDRLPLSAFRALLQQLKLGVTILLRTLHRVPPDGWVERPDVPASRARFFSVLSRCLSGWFRLARIGRRYKDKGLASGDQPAQERVRNGQKAWAGP
jgi:hypothetical protein